MIWGSAVCNQHIYNLQPRWRNAREWRHNARFALVDVAGLKAQHKSSGAVFVQ